MTSGENNLELRTEYRRNHKWVVASISASMIKMRREEMMFKTHKKKKYKKKKKSSQEGGDLNLVRKAKRLNQK
jgi:hypothetical protein